jgi:type II secretory pathway pseudopilin PulG
VSSWEAEVKNRDNAHKYELGVSLIELLIVVGILGALALLLAPTAGKIIRRSQAVAGYTSIRQALATARLQAVKRGVNVVVEFSLTPNNRIRVHTFQDRANDETDPLPSDEFAAAGNFTQEASFLSGTAAAEPTLGDFVVPSNIAVWKQGGTKDDLGEGIAFDEYNGNNALTDRVAFLPTGGIAPPEDTATSGLPTTSGGRGIYFADAHGKNFLRMTIDSDVSGRLRIDKYKPGAGYRSSGWVWF